MAQLAEPKPLILVYEDDYHLLWWLESFDDYSEKDYFFTRNGIFVKRISADLESISFDAVTEPSVWIVYQTSLVAPKMDPVKGYMIDRYYQLCHATDVGADTVILLYRWQALDCDTTPASQLSDETTVIDYQFYGARLKINKAKLLFSDHWRGKADIEYEDYAMSYQVVSTDWEVVAQLDLGLWSQDRLRQLTIDLAQVPPGTYRLMAVVYDPQSRERLPWHNNADWIPEMLPLANVDIPP